jgi:hypothetical protein
MDDERGSREPEVPATEEGHSMLLAPIADRLEQISGEHLRPPPLGGGDHVEDPNGAHPPRARV